MPRSRQPPERLEYFIDRALGRHLVPDALRAAGRIVHTMLSVYGADNEQQVADETWLAEAGRNGWVVLTKDDKIRRRPAELEAVRRHCVRVVCITNRNLTGQQQVDRIMANIHRIDQRARQAGPWIYAVHERQLTQLWPREQAQSPR